MDLMPGAAATSDTAAGLNTSVAAMSMNSAPNPQTVTLTTAAAAAMGNELTNSASAAHAGPMPLISNAAARAAATAPARAVSTDSAASKAAAVSASTGRATSPPDPVPANGAADSTDTGADVQALAAAVRAAPASETPGGAAPSASSSSAAIGLATPDTGANLQDAAQANAAQAIAAQIPARAVEMQTVQAAAAAAAAASVQALTRASVAADKPTSGSDAVPSLSLNSSDAAAGAAQLLTNAPVSGQATAAPVLNVAARVDSNEFGQGVANQVSFMVDRNLNSASLQVNPPSLGPIEVRIALQGGHAQVWMTSHSAVTRDALESSSSKLREMLGTQGFGQVSVDISQRSFQERSSQSQSYDALPPIERSAAAGAALQSRSAASIARAASGFIDAYA
jgi:flagellar hook-length control protein FliK